MIQVKATDADPSSVIEIDDDGEEPEEKKKKVHKQSTLESFMKPEKATTQSVIAELVSKDGLTFNQISSSRWMQILLANSGFNPPKSHNTSKAYATKEAALYRSSATEELAELKRQGKKFSTSVDEQTTAANFRILNVQLYSEAGNFNLGMVRIHVSCKADKMVEVRIEFTLKL